MDIKIGFADSPRELVIATDYSQEEAVTQISAALKDETGLLELNDEKGRKYLIRPAKISYVELGTANQSFVGFAPGV